MVLTTLMIRMKSFLKNKKMTGSSTKHTKKDKEPFSVMIAFSFVSFVLFVFEKAFVVQLLFLVIALPHWALHGKRALFLILSIYGIRGR